MQRCFQFKCYNIAQSNSQRVCTLLFHFRDCYHQVLLDTPHIYFHTQYCSLKFWGGPRVPPLYETASVNMIWIHYRL